MDFQVHCYCFLKGCAPTIKKRTALLNCAALTFAAGTEKTSAVSCSEILFYNSISFTVNADFTVNLHQGVHIISILQLL